jgi:potassium-dependent mechanosensitive channel
MRLDMRRHTRETAAVEGEMSAALRIRNGMLALAIAALAALALMASAGWAQSPPAAPPAAAATASRPAAVAVVTPLRLAVDDIEAAVTRDGLPLEALLNLRARIGLVRDQLRAAAADIGPHLDQLGTRLKELGPAPAQDAPPEAASVTSEREHLKVLYAEYDAAARQARQLELRADNVADRIGDRGRAILTNELFAHSPSILDPYFWLAAATEVPGELRSLGVLLRSWWGYALDQSGHGRMAAAAATLAAFAVLATVVARWWRRRVFVHAPGEARFAKALAGLRTLIEVTLWLALIVIGVLVTLRAYDLLPQRMLQIGLGLAAGILVAGVGRGVGKAVLAPFQPERRLLALDDRTARQLYHHLAWAVRIWGMAIFLNVVRNEVVAPLILTLAVNAVLATVAAALVLDLLVRVRVEDGDPAPRAQWVRATGWISFTVITVALVTGYVGFAAFVTERLLSVIVVFGVLYLLTVVTDTLFAEVLTADKPRARAVAAHLGLRPRTVELIGTVLSAALRVFFLVVAIAFAIGPRGLLAVEVFGAVQEAALGFRLGGVTISLTAILSALAALLILLVATRAVQRWLQTRLLPRTSLDPSLQLSVSTILGYVGVIAAVALALGVLGIDLQKIALVAGALSVGIGFGLQSIVSNFVSGLILLAERPIRVGDSIVVKGEEGLVRRIRVRATEVETFERATVIIPNSDLISGVVKNWTHADTTGRVIVQVGVNYDADPDQVRDILLACAGEHPLLLKFPPPSVFLMAFGASALEFELRCVVANVDNGLRVKSDLHFAVLRRFRAAGISIPVPQREVRVRHEADAILVSSAPPSAVASAPPSAVASAPPSAVASAPPSAIASAPPAVASAPSSVAPAPHAAAAPDGR